MSTQTDAEATAPQLAAVCRLPAELIGRFAALSGDEKTVRVMMGTCRRWREAAEAALRPHLASKTVVVEPPMMKSRFTSIRALDDKAAKTRLSQLDQTSQRFERHLKAYPPSSEHLRKLTIEVNDQTVDITWRQLDRLMNQLEELNVHVFDGSWSDMDVCDHDDIDTENPGDGGDLWDCEKSLGGGYWPCNYGTSVPNALRKLSLSATSRVFQHLQSLSEYISELRELSLGTHWSDDDVHATWTGPGTYIPSMPHLTRFTLVGGWQTIRDAVAILPRFPALRELIIYFPGYTFPGQRAKYKTTWPAVIARSLSYYYTATNLALYGPLAAYILTSVQEIQQTPKFQQALCSVTMLSLEAEVAQGMTHCYPLLDTTWLHKNPSLPALQHITFVLPSAKHQNRLAVGPDDTPSGEVEAPSHISQRRLRALFKRYDTLRQIQWVVGYPDDPFSARVPDVQLQPGVALSVDRPEIGADGKEEPLVFLRAEGV
ncbi:uncharacterized protein MKK02DRAFT_37991 [Dioszegia hungarica]|uniref:Uncharacterized protein n=1 Tax=Dioszegia hungarica TaxID=4972 RepID=A0AA38H5K1_9TREE|nr:uncharacterized protein MKK02DRAFT_37991 [Dioszegia hungarica]KAI9634460.1 hypothetical protein MKK02DRAFT_37991 [Dioszegia hungarica]